MRRKMLLAIALLALGPTPIPAEEGLSAGHVMEARILGLDPHLFSRVELSQIRSEERRRDRRDRIRFILQMKERRGEVPPGFSRSPEGRRIIMSAGF